MKKRLLYAVLLFIMVIGIASTAFAASYSGNFTRSVLTIKSVPVKVKVKDENRHCFYGTAGGNTVHTSYTSLLIVEGHEIRDKKNSSGCNIEINHSPYFSPGKGKLKFWNDYASGKLLYISGDFYGY